MKSFIAIAVLCAVIYLASATPVPSESEEVAQPALPADMAEEAPLIRQKRATCDLLSGFGVADSACALHCIGLRRRGGYCERGTCHCR